LNHAEHCPKNKPPAKLNEWLTEDYSEYHT
jgi:hypothetical protein